ncbi:MAG: GvpL/GvpF family gas vesicle protein [Mariniphaga sp.]
MENSLIYLYCVGNSPPMPLLHLEATGVKSLRIDDFFVIFKEVPAIDFSEENFKRHLSDKRWSEFRAREHGMVLSLIMENSEVVPFNFGTLFHSESSLKKFIADHSDTLSEEIGSIGGSEEWTIQVFCNRKVLYKQIDEMSAQAAKMEKEIMASSPGKAYLLKQKKTELIKIEMDRICKDYGVQYLDQFSNLSDSFHLNNLLPKEFTEREDTMILNANFLVNKKEGPHFKEILEIRGKRDKNQGFFPKLLGPFPPFTFVFINRQ